MSKIFDIIDVEAIEKLADIVNEKDLGEITVGYEGKSVTVKGKKPAPPAPPAGGFAPAMPPVSPAAAAAVTEPIEMSPKTEEISGTPVKAPIVGTYYSKPRPDAAPFVTVGSEKRRCAVYPRDHEGDERDSGRERRNSYQDTGSRRRFARVRTDRNDTGLINGGYKKWL